MPPIDSFEMNSRVHGINSSGATGTAVLQAGVTYIVTVDGTLTVWGGNLAGSHPAVKYNSPGQASREAAFDADVQFADELTVISPRHSELLHMSTDGGASFSHREPVGGPYSTPQAADTYTYNVVGGGYPLRVRITDGPLGDNNGILKVAVEAPLEIVGRFGLGGGLLPPVSTYRVAQGGGAFTFNVTNPGLSLGSGPMGDGTDFIAHVAWIHNWDVETPGGVTSITGGGPTWTKLDELTNPGNPDQGSGGLALFRVAGALNGTTTTVTMSVPIRTICLQLIGVRNGRLTGATFKATASGDLSISHAAMARGAVMGYMEQQDGGEAWTITPALVATSASCTVGEYQRGLSLYSGHWSPAPSSPVSGANMERWKAAIISQFA